MIDLYLSPSLGAVSCRHAPRISLAEHSCRHRARHRRAARPGLREKEYEEPKLLGQVVIFNRRKTIGAAVDR